MLFCKSQVVCWENTGTLWGDVQEGWNGLLYRFYCINSLIHVDISGSTLFRYMWHPVPCPANIPISGYTPGTKHFYCSRCFHLSVCPQAEMVSRFSRCPLWLKALALSQLACVLGISVFWERLPSEHISLSWHIEGRWHQWRKGAWQIGGFSFHSVGANIF